MDYQKFQQVPYMPEYMRTHEEGVLKIDPFQLSEYAVQEIVQNLDDEGFSTITGLRLSPYKMNEETIAFFLSNLEKCRNLLFLELSSLETLSTFPEAVFGLRNLIYLSVSSEKQIRELPSEIGQLTNLLYLDIGGNAITTLPPEIGKLQKLQEFYWYDSDIKEICTEFFSLKSLTQLYLSRSSIRVLSEEISSLESLEKLFIEATQLETLPDSIGKLQNLKELNIEGSCLVESQLHTLPESLSDLANLEKLILGDNPKLKALPKNIGALTSLRELQFSNCEGIKKLPESIGELGSLEILEGRGSAVSTLPDSMGNLNVVREISFSFSPLKSIPDSLCNCTKLEKLQLLYTKIKKLPADIGTVESLRFIELKGCEGLKKIPLSLYENRTIVLDIDRESLNPGGVKKTAAVEEPKCDFSDLYPDTHPQISPNRFSLASPLYSEQFEAMCLEHATFLEGYQGRGQWQSLIIGSDIIMSVFQGEANDGQADFSKKDLSGKGISAADRNLACINLTTSIARGIDFSRTDIHNSMGTDSNFSGAIFVDANLSRGDFSRSIFHKCDFTGANLEGVDLENCDLRGANFTNANMIDVKLSGALMDDCIGLSTAKQNIMGYESYGNGEIRLSVGYEDSTEGVTLKSITEKFLHSSRDDVESITIGTWEEAYEESPQDALNLLAENSHKLPNLKKLFVGDMSFEDCEISWITQGHYGGIFEAFPQLEDIHIKGSQDLSLGEKIVHHNLKSLRIECGGLDKSVIKTILNSELPSLEYLQLYLGVEDYGCTIALEDLRGFMETGRFPNLNYLGLMNSIIQDDIAVAMAEAPIVEQLSTLDLSNGALTDKGAEALLASDTIKKLEMLDLHYHYMSSEMVTKLETLPITVDLSERQEWDEDYRYPAVTE